MNKKLLLLLILSIFFNTNNLHAIKGKITDKTGNPVPSATIVFTNNKDSTKIYKTTTDVNGIYSLELPTFTIEKNDKQFTFFDIYPNPFYTGTVIPFFLNKTGICYIYIYNLMGQKVKTISERVLTAGLHQLIWDGTTDKNQRVSPGFFIAYMHFEGRSSSQKIIMRVNNNEDVFPEGIPYIPDLDTSKIINYNVKITSATTLPYSIGSYIINDINNVNFVVFKKLAVPFKVSGSYLSVNKGDNTYDTIFVNGINLGVGKPGTFPGEMAATSEDYRRWFKEIADIGFNTIRIYTLHYPRFYDEFARYNMENPDKPLYLLHGIWLDEDKPQGNFYSFTNEFISDIYEVVDCLHGNRIVPERPGRASGKYITNVSPWLLGYIAGREIHPEEVEKTNNLNDSYNSYNGFALSMPDSTGEPSPTECWIVNALDMLILHERQTYQVERPVSFSSWPTLDPLPHNTEVFPFSLEDYQQLDFTKIVLNNAPAGFFVSYHAYPYYPDFMTDEYGIKTNYFDSIGINGYIPYLKNLWTIYVKFKKFPVIIAEYGVPSSWGNAHFVQSGMGHGGHSEEIQGIYNARMLGNIHSDANLAGGCLFAWIDEWFKQTWIVNPMTCTPDRRPMWHNLTSPEENFGLKKFIPDTVWFLDYPKFFSYGNDIKDVKVATDFQYYHLKINLNDSITNNDTILIAFDTYGDTLGESRLPNGKNLFKRAEFFLTITSDSANLFVTQAYNTYGMFFIRKWWPDTLRQFQFHSTKTTGAPWYLITWKTSIRDTGMVNQLIGQLHSRDSLDADNSLNAVTRNKYSYEIKIPWQLLNFTDPSLMRVLDDNRDSTRYITETVMTQGVATEIYFKNSVYVSNRIAWDTWGFTNPNTGEFVFPKYREVRKKSYDVFKERIKLMNLKPKI